MPEIIDGVSYPEQHEFNKTAQNEIADRLKLIAEAAGGGVISVVNGSQTPLGSGATFTGSWEVNSFEHVLVNVLTDQPGTLYVDFAIVKDGVDTSGTIGDADVVQTLAAPVPVYANSAYFRALVKGAGRAYRLRYTNDAVAQTSFTLLSVYGSNIFPPSTSPDNELLVTVKESERSHFVALAVSDVAATTYRILVDLSDTTNFPHSNIGHIELSSVYINVDRESTARGLTQLGVITRIDGTSADIEYLQGVGFEKGSESIITRDRIFAPNRMKCTVVGGALSEAATSFVDAANTAVNTGVTFSNATGGTSTPAVGDVIAKFTHISGGTYDATFSGFYFAEKS